MIAIKKLKLHMKLLSYHKSVRTHLIEREIEYIHPLRTIGVVVVVMMMMIERLNDDPVAEAKA